MKVTFAAYDNFHGISHVIGVKFALVGSCGRCKSKSLHVEFADNEVDQDLLADAVVRLGELIRSAKLDV